jgi:phosphopantetheinyl transferase
MMPVSWRYAAIEATCREAGPAGAWLAPREQRVWAGLGDPRRRMEWLAGRITAKRLVSERLRPAGKTLLLPRIEIDSGDGRGHGAPPRVLLDGRPLWWRLSIAHSERSLLVALADGERPGVGVDLLGTVDCGRGFAELWFTGREQRWLAGQPRLWPLAWAVKEAAYKASNRGEAFRPRAFEVLPCPGGGFSCLLRGRHPAMLCRLSVWRTPGDETAILALYEGQSDD